MRRIKKDVFYELIDKAKRIHDSQYGELTKVYIVGSQSILSISDNPTQLLSQTKDVDILTEEYNSNYDNQVSWVAGENSDFMNEFGQYIDVVKEEYLTLPKNWKSRTIKETANTSGGKIDIHYLNPNDLVFAKIYANREKDREYVDKLFKFKMVSPKMLNKIWANEFSKQLTFEDSNEIDKNLQLAIAGALRHLHRKYYGKNENTHLISGVTMPEELNASLKSQEDKLSKKEKHLRNNTKFKIKP